MSALVHLQQCQCRTAPYTQPGLRWNKVGKNDLHFLGRKH